MKQKAEAQKDEYNYEKHTDLKSINLKSYKK